MKRNSAGCDKVKVRMVDSTYWGEGVNFNNKFLHIPSQYVRDYERLLMGGVWAQVDMRFESDQESKGKNPFWIDKLVPIQIATFDLDDYRNVRKQFTTDEWIDLIVRSMGYEPGEMSRRLKLLFLVRLIPLGERNYNLVELGPRGTGKSYVIQEVSPYTALLTGGTTVANLFGHMSGRQKGMVQIWDVVGFDEVAEPCGMPRRLSRASVVRVLLPRSSVSSTEHSSHILIRCSTRRSTIRRATDLRSSVCGMLPK
jgi:ATP-dependent Lon protease